jgi:hypothetical protein
MKFHLQHEDVSNRYRGLIAKALKSVPCYKLRLWIKSDRAGDVASRNNSLPTSPCHVRSDMMLITITKLFIISLTSMPQC